MIVREALCVTLFCLLLQTLTPEARAANEYEGRTIADIQFSPRQLLDPADLARILPIRKGEPLHAAGVSEAIDALFATGHFADIVAEAEPSGDGVIVRFVAQPVWFVGNVTLRGKLALPPNAAQVEASSQITAGSEFHEQDVTTAVESIRTLLTQNGMYNAEIAPEVHRDDALQQVYLTFTLREHKRARYEMPVIHGKTNLPESTIVHATGWRMPIIHIWHHVTAQRTSAGVRGVLQKLQKEDRLTSKAHIETLNYDQQKNRVQPVVSVATGPKVKVSAVEGKVSKGVLHRYVPVFEEHSLDNDLLVEGKRNLEDYLQSQGYYDASVDFRQRPPENDVVKVEYVISKGQRYKLARLTIRGNRYFRAAAIEERMFTHAATLTMRRGRYSEAFRRKDEENVADLYKSNGFRDVKVTTEVTRGYGGNSSQLAVTVNIDEGPQWVVEKLSIAGIDPAKAERLISTLSSGEGQPFSESALANDRNSILNYYSQQGYPSATVQATWKLSETSHRANVTYTIAEGDHQFVREVIVTGLHTTRRSLVDRAIGIKAGDPLSPSDELDAQKRLYDLGVFARVDTAIENPDGDTNRKYMLYSFDEANRYRLTLGVGAQVANFGTPSTTSVASPGGTIGFSPQGSIEISRFDFLGLGHTVSLKGAYSSLEQRVSLSYLQPRIRDIHGLDVTYSLLYDNSLDVRTFAAKREEASVQVSDRFSKSLTGLVKFAYRRVSVSDVVIPVLLVPQLVQPVRIGMLSANLSQDRRDSAANPTRGMYNTVDVGLAGNFFGSQRSFARILVRNATYYRLTKNLVLARQTRFGIIEPFSVPAGTPATESVPLPERFFGGGADSMRGFSYNQAGPRDTGAPLIPGGPTSEATGFPLGGNALLFNNVELRFPLIGENIQGVLFYDAGNVYSSLGNISFRFNQRNLQDFDYMVHAPGFGLRYKTPIGPIRVDLAYSINPPSFNGFSGTPEQLLQCNPNLPPSGYCQSTKQTLGHIQFFFSIGQTF